MNTNFSLKSDSFFKNNQFQDALKYFQEQSTHYSATKQMDLSVHCGLYVCEYLILMSQYQKCLDQAEYLKELYKKHALHSVVLYQTILYHEAHAHFYLGQYEKARQLIRIPQQGGKKDEHEIFALARNYMLLGKIFWKKGNFSEARRYLYHALQYFNSIKSKIAHHHIAKVHNLLGIVFLAMGELKKGGSYHEKAKNLIEALIEQNQLCANHLYKGIIYNDLGRLQMLTTKFFTPKRIGEVAAFFRDALYIFNSVEQSPLYRYKAGARKNQGNLYKLAKREDQARLYFNAELKIRKELIDVQGRKHHPTLGRVLNHLAEIHFLQGRYQEALSNAHKAIIAVVSRFKDKAKTSNPIFKSRKDLDRIDSYTELLKGLKIKAEVFLQYFKTNNETKNLEVAHSTLEVAIDVINKIKDSYNNEPAELIIMAQSRPIYELALNCLYEHLEVATPNSRYYNLRNKFFEVIQQCKSVSLLKNVYYKKQQLIQYSAFSGEYEGLDDIDDIILEDGAFGQSLTFYERNSRSSSVQRPKESPRTVNIRTLQKEIAYEETAIVSYFVGEKDIFALIITKQQFKVKKLNQKNMLTTYELERMVIKFREILCGEYRPLYLEETTLYSYISLADRLHRVLIQPLDLPEIIDRLYVIPDDFLAYIPFGAFLSTRPTAEIVHKGKFKYFDYLIRKYCITYHSSIALLYYNYCPEDKDEEEDLLKYMDTDSVDMIWTKDKDYLGVVPYSDTDYGSKKNIIEKEIRQVAKLFKKNNFQGIKTIKGDKITSREVKQEIAKYNIVHLTGHNEYSPHPGLPLSKRNNKIVEFLDGNDINGMDLKTVLVVLTACHMGASPQLIKGEGILSFHRAFLNAAVQNIVYTLFAVPEKTSYRLIKRFFQLIIKKKMYFSDALRMAKLEIIEQGKSPQYWSGIVFTGNKMAAIPLLKDRHNK